MSNETIIVSILTFTFGFGLTWSYFLKRTQYLKDATDSLREMILEKKINKEIKIDFKSIDLSKDQVIVIKTDGLCAEQMLAIKDSFQKELKTSKNKIIIMFLPNDTEIDVLEQINRDIEIIPDIPDPKEEYRF
jgi:vacuolar-type H+-ATPase subunit I/STV1